MNCHDAVERLSEYACGRLQEDADRTAMDMHLRDCDDCRAEATSIRSLLALLDAEVPSETLRADFDRWLEPARRRMARRRALGWWSLAAVAASIAVLVLFPVRRELSPPPAPDRVVRPDRVREIAASTTDSGRENAERLLVTLERDPHPALRVAALDALLQTPAAPTRRDLHRVLRREASPLVREALSNAIEELDE